ncbi:MAG TPA: hypothetical protein VFQ60_02380 [Patescibacteria group bacterium]|nr:hypothetical protein [Patescibacteria group bacterium]
MERRRPGQQDLEQVVLGPYQHDFKKLALQRLWTAFYPDAFNLSRKFLDKLSPSELVFSTAIVLDRIYRVRAEDKRERAPDQGFIREFLARLPADVPISTEAFDLFDPLYPYPGNSYHGFECLLCDARIPLVWKEHADTQMQTLIELEQSGKRPIEFVRQRAIGPYLNVLWVVQSEQPFPYDLRLYVKQWQFATRFFPELDKQNQLATYLLPGVYLFLESVSDFGIECQDVLQVIAEEWLMRRDWHPVNSDVQFQALNRIYSRFQQVQPLGERAQQALKFLSEARAEEQRRKDAFAKDLAELEARMRA